MDGGKGLYSDHVAAARAAGVEMRFGSPVQGLCRDEQGRVCGVEVETDAGVEIIGGRTVVLAAGGFRANTELCTRYLGVEWVHAKVRVTPDNSGDLLEPAFAVGAAGTGDWSGAHATAWDPTGDGVRGDRELTNRMTKQSFPIGIVVNRDGQRFLDEGADFRNYTYAKYGVEILKQPGAMAVQLFDAKTRPMLREDEYTSPSIRSAQANTVEGVCEALGADPQVCAATVAAFNAAIQPGTFDPTMKDWVSTTGLQPARATGRCRWTPLRSGGRGHLRHHLHLRRPAHRRGRAGAGEGWVTGRRTVRGGRDRGWALPRQLPGR